jgi:hypothetical protein
MQAGHLHIPEEFSGEVQSLKELEADAREAKRGL